MTSLPSINSEENCSLTNATNISQPSTASTSDESTRTNDHCKNSSHISSSHHMQSGPAKPAKNKETQHGMLGKSINNSDATDKKSPDIPAATCPICRESCLQSAGHNMRQLSEGGEEENKYPCRLVQDFLEDQPPEYFQPFLLTRKDLKRFIVMDIVFPCLQKTTCFTKRYVSWTTLIFMTIWKIFRCSDGSKLHADIISFSCMIIKKYYIHNFCSVFIIDLWQIYIDLDIFKVWSFYGRSWFYFPNVSQYLCK